MLSEAERLRRARQASALRENLKRRKTQSRGRAAAGADRPADGQGSPPETDRAKEGDG
jgi:hypothetical protein